MTAVEFTNEAREDLRDLDGSARKLILKAITKLRDEPEKRGEPLSSQASGNLTTFRKLVVGDRDYRIVYRVEPAGTVCVVWVIAKRADADVYDMAISRLKLYSDRTDLADELAVIIDRARSLDRDA